MRSKRVVLLSNRSLLASGVQRLLQGVVGLELTVVAAKIRKLTSCLDAINPDVILLDSGDAAFGHGLISRLLAQHPDARVIALNVDRRGIDVYRVQRVLQTDLGGLLKAIQGKAAPAKQRPVLLQGDSAQDGGGTMGP